MEIAANQKLVGDLDASLELQCRESMEIRKHVTAGFEADLEGLKAWKLEQNNMTKKRPFFGPQNMSKRAKMGLPFFFEPVAGLRYLRLTRLPRHDRGPVPGGDRSAASCLCTVLRRAL